MKNLILISALVLSVVSTVFSQTPDDKFFENINTGYLEQMIHKKINSFLLDEGIPQLSFDKSTYKSARYQSRFVNKYFKYRSNSTDQEPVDGIILKTKQDRLDYYSDEEGVVRRKYIDLSFLSCVNCRLTEWNYMTYDDISNLFLEYFKTSEPDVMKKISESKYLGVSVQFSISEGETIMGSGIYMLTITSVTSIDNSESI